MFSMMDPEVLMPNEKAIVDKKFYNGANTLTLGIVMMSPIALTCHNSLPHLRIEPGLSVFCRFR